MADLNERQRKFVERYMAHGEKMRAAVEAGYSKTSAHSQATTLLKNPKVLAALSGRQEEDPNVATRAERQAFWTDAMRGTVTVTVNGETQTLPVDMKDRLRASELLGKTGGDFKETVEGDLVIRVLRDG